MKSYKKTFDKKHKVTRILLNDYLVLKEISQRAGVSMAEALHRLIEHQAQLPLLDMRAQPIIAARLPVMPAATAGIKSVTVKLRATVAGKESSNGA